MFRILLAFSLLLGLVSGAWGQTILSGKVVDAETNAPLADVAIYASGTGSFAVSDESGFFTLSGLTPGSYTLIGTRASYFPGELTIQFEATSSEKPVVFALRRDPTANTSGDIPTVTLDEAEAEAEGQGEIANLLHANRDIFQNIAGFGWSFFRFRERGYDSENFPLLLNGIPLNDPETGIAFYGEFGGLNDVMRYRQTAIGLNAADFSFGGIGGANILDTRASVQRKQIRASYSSTNRIYRNRVMLTASTGLMPGGWAVSVSGSHRWAEEGYVPGTFFDAWSYFLSIDKKIGTRHSINLTVLGAPNRRGRSADSFQEMYDIAGTNYYNPLWGYQNGEKRNSQVQYNHQPIGILRYDWTPEPATSITASVYAQGGINSFTRLNWLDAGNPAPDFNRRLPSSLLDSTQTPVWAEQLSADEGLRQIDWAAMYNANRRNPFTVENAEGIAGNTVSGNRALYIVEDQRSDSREFGGNIFVRHNPFPGLTINGGLNYQWYEGQNFKLVDDLLGADFWFDQDFFSLFDGGTQSEAGNPNLLNPNNVVREGERFGYDYNENIRRGQGWIQAQFDTRRFQYFIAAELGQSQFWRTGNFQNGRYPNTSLGDSEKQSFVNYGFKGGIVFKANGRNYLYANGYYGTRAPQVRDALLSPRVSNNVLNNLELSTIQSVEGGYLLRAPNVKVRLTGYYTEFKNETEFVFANAMTVSRVLDNLDLGALNLDDVDVFLATPVFFGSGVLQGVDRRHAGVELGVEYKLSPAISFIGAGNLGQYLYTGRPDLWLSLDNAELPALNLGKVYQKNFYIPRTPQTAASLGLRYEGKQFWFASLTGNYTANFYYDFDRVRRTERFVEGLDNETPAFREIIDQKKAPEAFTLDFFGGKSFRFKTRYFLYINVGVNNILNNQNVIVSGRDSYRNAFRNDISDMRFYTTEVLYAPGINYFLNVAIRM